LKERLDVFCDRLKQRAQQLGLTGAAVAERLELGLRAYAYYASGARQPNLHMLLRICDVLVTHPNYLLGVSDDPAPPRKHRAG